MLKHYFWLVAFALIFLVACSTNSISAETTGDDFDEFIQQLLEGGRRLPAAEMQEKTESTPERSQRKTVFDTPGFDFLESDTPIVEPKEEEHAISTDTEQLFEIIRRLQADMREMQETVKRLEKEVTKLRTDTIETSPEEVVEMEGPEETEVDSDKLNPNVASLDKLREIPGMPNHIAERIRWYREEVGAFTHRDELEMVPGISTSLFRQIEEYFAPGPYEDAE